MNNELIIKTTTQNHKVFLQNGFYKNTHFATPLHNHIYPEIHISAGGNAEFKIGNITHSTNKGNLMIIPKGIFHSCTVKNENTLHTAFQVDCDVNTFSSYSISNDTVLDFFEEIKKCEKSHNYSTISSYIALFCNYFYDEKATAHTIRDYGFLIHEFFSTRYNENVHLCDLADVLHLSERQTERLIIKYTGNTFKDELVKTRMAMAKQLLKSSDMLLSEAAQYVGYRSYAGFWKAFQKYNS